MSDELMTGDEMQPDQERASFGNYGGATRQKVELQPLIDKMLHDVELIDSDPHMSRSEKTKRITRVAESLKKRLYEDKRRKDEDKLQPSSYRRYLTLVRKAVTAKNWRHHAIEESARRLAKRHPRYAEQLNALAELTDITELRLAHRDLLAQVRQDRDHEAFEAIQDMKLDHEVMRHLVLPKAIKEELATQATATLEERATNTVEINYYQYIEAAHRLLTDAEIGTNGEAVQRFSSLALGLAMVTGRREVEVLKLGRFKKVGEYELEFSGQAKRRGGVDYGASYRIYSLIQADQVLEALDRLRALPEVLELQHLDNIEINRRVAKTLNTVAKRVLGSEARVFKDSRAIWARIVFEIHFTRDARWKTVNETVFWREMLGHEDMDTQESYKAFKISYANEAPAEPVSKYASRLEALEALDEQAAGGVASQRIHSWVKKAVAASPDVLISQKAISVNVGSHRQAIKDYLSMASEALATPNRPARAVAPAVPAEVANARPRVSVLEISEGRFVAVAKLNGVEIARAEGNSREEAQMALFEAASGKTTA